MTEVLGANICKFGVCYICDSSSQTALVTILSLQCKAANWLSGVVGFTAVCLLTARSTNNKDLATAGLKVIGQ